MRPNGSAVHLAYSVTIRAISKAYWPRGTTAVDKLVRRLLEVSEPRRGAWLLPGEDKFFGTHKTNSHRRAARIDLQR